MTIGPTSIDAMTADKAYQQGKIAAERGQSAHACPYKTAKLIGLRRVWLTAYNETMMILEKEEKS